MNTFLETVVKMTPLLLARSLWGRPKRIALVCVSQCEFNDLYVFGLINPPFCLWTAF